ncbi:hypothetical protein ACTL6P_19350 [Endozoicomonas acroporae]|uniref:hypothetical protein n=1 Tax=Endozoicomonas acroporae TaxID=1701104 RepID=UPI000C768750|nr:hypothetical protein [Endozoicomonas acroporae]
MKKLPPYGRRLVVPNNKIIVLFVGAPHCWIAARESINKGHQNILVLPTIASVTQYQWPVEHKSVIVVDFTGGPISDLDRLAQVLMNNGAAFVGASQLGSDTSYQYEENPHGKPTN